MFYMQEQIMHQSKGFQKNYNMKTSKLIDFRLNLLLSFHFHKRSKKTWNTLKYFCSNFIQILTNPEVHAASPVWELLILSAGQAVDNYNYHSGTGILPQPELLNYLLRNTFMHHHYLQYRFFRSKWCTNWKVFIVLLPLTHLYSYHETHLVLYHVIDIRPISCRMSIFTSCVFSSPYYHCWVKTFKHLKYIAVKVVNRLL